ncbi:heat shock 70 kDa protein 12A-like [Clupea harengus]|uniref:Heat shock 70 kDa protein 12A-like n=1 Tax=Clupea harengus TaxID=7950 RepID=A0A6P8G368_CLUHA|nr:heat shock 70 kDa protein 12A-like [Clupea harengus]
MHTVALHCAAPTLKVHISMTTFVVAIDFGTAYSGYCFCVRSNPSVIKNPHWGRSKGFDTLKTPTCILFDEYGEFLKFGYDALMAYKTMGQNKKRFFNHFKMQLYNKSISRNMMISDSGGRSMEAMKVFSESLRYLKDHALNMISNHTNGRTFSASNVTWVLTVPAIWNPAAKQFMREAAIQGGLVTETDSSKLIIALEPEAASVWCKQLPSDGFISEGLDNNILEQNTETQYIVVDCGGGTVDITVHEVLDKGLLKELHRASGNDMGGGSVDAKFKNLLRDTFGHVLWDEYEKANPSEVQKMMFEFTTFKCCNEKEEVFIACHYNLTELLKEKQDIFRFFRGVQGVSWSDGVINISYSKLETLFRESVDKIVQDIRAILLKPEIDIDYILLVGGYASCSILQDEVKRQFGRQCRILCPVDAQLAVAKGAVLFGVNPKIVASRVSALTYGTDIAPPFDPKKHKVQKRRVNKTNDYVYCDDVFRRFVQKGQSVVCDQTVEFTFTPVDSNQTNMSFQFYGTEEPDAMYVDEPGMKNIGQFIVNMPDIRNGRNRDVKLEVSFGLTEIQATATDKTSNERESVRLDFMTQ